MGSCLSKKNTTTPSPELPPPPDLTNPNNPEPEKKQKKAEEETVKKEIFVIKHRRSHDTDRRCSSEEEKSRVDQKVADFNNNGGLGHGVAAVRTSSCTKEEVDAILIQCGRLSQSAGGSGSGSGTSHGGRKYSGSKRSYDFNQEIVNRNGGYEDDEDDDEDVVSGGGADDERIHRNRQNQRQSRVSPSHGRRRTPSRERDQQQRSGSRERCAGGGGNSRRVSRSPGRRSESPITNSNGATTVTPSSSTIARPGKMVSVPATVTSGNGSETVAVKRISVKRNAGDSRTVASPRSRSPNVIRVLNENQQQPLSLSRSNSRKAEHSPYRRNPLNEIDQNSLPCNKTSINTTTSNFQYQKLNFEIGSNKKVAVNCCPKEQQQPMTRDITVTPVTFKDENPILQTLTRSRSSRRGSRDFDIINPEAPLNTTTTPSSYTTLLLEDIQNFHQKKNTTTAFSLPACVTKACSIVDAVADLNSGNKRTSEMFFFGKTPPPPPTKDPFVESEVGLDDDLMEPSFHKYVTMQRGGADMDGQESSGSNSIAGSLQQIADSTDCSTSSRFNNARESEGSPRVQRRLIDNNQRSGIGRGRVGGSSFRGLNTVPTAKAAATST